MNASDRRLVSLDVFRGLTVAGMVLVNNPGTWRAIYPPLRHADWHGWTPTDLIFPFFLFVVGIAIPLSLGPRVETAGRAPVIARIVRRAVVIFALGIVLNGFPDFPWATLRIPGVLQRIAVCYLLAALVFLITGWRTKAVIVAMLLVGYWAAMMLVPVPGYGAGDLSKEGSLASYLDRVLLGPHLWRAARVYDPEGVLSTVPALATTLLGVLTGVWLRTARPRRTIAAGLVVGAVAGLALGQLWSVWFPINKALWTSSYVLFTTGFALAVLALIYWLVEMRGWRRWAVPFVVFGVNALALYFLSSLVARAFDLIHVGAGTVHEWLYTHVFAAWTTPINASLAYAVAYVLVWWGLMALLYRRRVFIRV